MDTKLSSETLKAIHENLETLENLVRELQAQAEAWKAQAEAAEEALGIVASVSSLEKIKAAATADGLIVEEWVFEKLVEACQPRTELPVDTRIYEQCKSIAKGRGVSLSDFCRGVDMTDALQSIFDNRYV